MKLLFAWLFPFLGLFHFSCQSSSKGADQPSESETEVDATLSPISYEPMVNAEGPNKFALLVGINQYQNVSQLKGCINDVNLMKDLLVNRYDFLEGNIVTLTDGQATYQAILETFQEYLIENTEKGRGDIVVFYYSGHGSQQRDQQDGDEVDGWDETLVPVDYDTWKDGVRGISDDEINGLLLQLTERTDNVTFVIDACHSGGSSKNLFTKKSPIERDDREPPVLKVFAKGEEGELAGSDSAKYLLLAGCLANEQSYETDIAGGQRHGALTYYFVDELKKATGKVTYNDIFENVQAAVKKEVRNQTPQLEGLNKYNYIFGDPAEQAGNYLLVSLREDGQGVTVKGGAALGITKGSVFEVYPPRAKRFTSSEPSLGRIRITEVSSNQAEAEVIEGSIKEENARAVERVHNYEGAELHIRFAGDWTSLPLSKIKEDITSLEYAREAEGDGRSHLVLEAKKDAIQFYLAADTTVAANTVSASDPKKAVEQVTQWAKWYRALSIENPNSQLAIDLEIYATKGKGAKGGFDFLTETDGVFKHKSIFNIKITNRSDQDVYTYILDLRDNGDIEVFHLGQILHKNPNYTANEVLPAGDSVTFQLKASVPEGKQLSTDVFKLYATTDPEVNLQFLAQKGKPKDLDDEQEKVFDIESKNVDLVVSEEGQANDWATVERVLEVKR